jgi:hypothetical protein
VVVLHKVELDAGVGEQVRAEALKREPALVAVPTGSISRGPSSRVSEIRTCSSLRSSLWGPVVSCGGDLKLVRHRARALRGEVGNRVGKTALIGSGQVIAT